MPFYATNPSAASSAARASLNEQFVSAIKPLTVIVGAALIIKAKLKAGLGRVLSIASTIHCVFSTVIVYSAQAADFAFPLMSNYATGEFALNYTPAQLQASSLPLYTQYDAGNCLM